MNLRAGTWDFFQRAKDEIMLDIDSLQYLPKELVNTVTGVTTPVYDSLNNVLDAAYQEIQWDVEAFKYLPEEIGKSTAEIIEPPAQVVNKELSSPLSSVKWIVLGGLGIYALTLLSPKIKKILK